MPRFNRPPLRWPALLIGLTAFAVVGTTISPALGGPGLLTKQEAKWSFYTKKRAKKVFYTKRKARKSFYTKGRAEGHFLDSSEASARFLDPGEASARFLRPSDADARYLTPAQGDSRYLQPHGETRIAVGPAQWAYEPTSSDFTIIRGPDFMRVNRTGPPGLFQDLFLTPALPSQVYGRPMRLSGVELCYITGDTSLIFVELVRATSTAAQPDPSPTILVGDTTPRTDSTCRLYALGTPEPLGADDSVGMQLTVDFGSAPSTDFSLSRTTFILVP